MDTLTVIIGVTGLLIGVTALIYATFITRNFRLDNELRTYNTLRKLESEIVSLKAALEITNREIIGEQVTNNEKIELSNIIKSHITNEIQEKNIDIPFSINYNDLANNIKSIDTYYSSLENIYLSSPQGRNTIATKINNLANNDYKILLSTDIVGFRNIASESGHFEASKILEDIRSIINNEAKKYNGIIVLTVGDGSFIVFQTAIQAIFAARGIRNIILKTTKKKTTLRIYIVSIDKDISERINYVQLIEKHSDPDTINISSQIYKMLPKYLKEIATIKNEIKMNNETIPFYIIQPDRILKQWNKKYK
jgi:hypothetical protein